MAREHSTADGRGPAVDRGQLPMATIEAALGVMLIVGVSFGFALGVAPPDTRSPQLDTYASDAVTLLANEPPSHGGQTRLAEVAASEAAFEREADALERRVERILPANLMFRVETRHGAVGYPVPPDVETGVATVATGNGDVTVRVWYV